jgi:hypothetical protein
MYTPCRLKHLDLLKVTDEERMEVAAEMNASIGT